MMHRDSIEHVLSRSFADKLDEIIFSVGNTEYSRRKMVEELGCANFIAAAKLTKVLRRLKISSVKGIWDVDPVDLARAKGIGEASIFVVMCLLDAHKFDVEKWWGWNNNSVKFSTFKNNAISRAKRRSQEV